MERKQRPSEVTPSFPATNSTANASHNSFSSTDYAPKTGGDKRSSHFFLYHPLAYGEEAPVHTPTLPTYHQSLSALVPNPNLRCRVAWNQERLTREGPPNLRTATRSSPVPPGNAHLGQSTQADPEIHSHYVHNARVAQNQISPSYEHGSLPIGMSKARPAVSAYVAYPVHCAQYPNGLWNNTQRGFSSASYTTQIPGPLIPTSRFRGNYYSYELSHEAQRYAPHTTASSLVPGYPHCYHSKTREHNVYETNQDPKQVTATNLPPQPTAAARPTSQTQTNNPGTARLVHRANTAVGSSRATGIAIPRSRGSQIANKRHLSPNQAREEETMKVPKPYSCHKSDREFKHIHEQGHLKPKRKTCSWPGCDKVFSNQSNLSRHFRAFHLKERPHKCPHCSYASAEKSYMKEHITTIHLKIRPYKCSYPGCEKSFGREGTLITHYNSFHLYHVRPHKCPACRFKCAKRETLVMHRLFYHS